jgi:CheY-like chemotaxis protein
MHGMPLNGLMTGCTRVLIVDGEQDIVEVLEKILEDEAKYEVEVARGGFAAGMTAEKFRPHVILLDMHLSDIDGREVAKQVKANPDLQLTKLIAMSGKMTDDEAKGLTSQATNSTGFLRKPFHVRQVIEAIEDAWRSFTKRVFFGEFLQESSVKRRIIALLFNILPPLHQTHADGSARHDIPPIQQQVAVR